jgi:sugar transferase (PEP-CTERM/EpsH1 system associated)
MRLLFIAARLPDPLTRGYEVRAWHQIRLLAQRHAVTLIAYTVGTPRPAALARVHALCADVHTVPLHLPGMAAGVLRGLTTGRPLQTSIYDTPAMRRLVHGILRERRHDVVHVQMARMAALLDGVASPPRVVDLIDALSVNMARRGALDHGLTRWLATRERARLAALERLLCRTWERALVASEADRRAIGDFASLAVNCNAVDLEHFVRRKTERRAHDVVFSGNLGYFPNVDGAVWFAREVLPRVRAAVPEATLTLVGARPARAIRELATLGPHVELVGEVPDVAPYIGRASVAVAPLRAGSGQALKVLEAMACGTPVVATSRAIEGLAATDGVHLRIADDAAALADAVIALLRDAGARRRLADAARSLVESRYGWDVPVAALDAIYQEIATRAPAGADGSGEACGSSGS